MDSATDRLGTEIELLESMYPDQIKFDIKARDLIYNNTLGKLHLRLPDGYLDNALPEVLLATIGRDDVRDQAKQRVAELPIREEVLDSIILAFDQLAEEVSVCRSDDQVSGTVDDTPEEIAKRPVTIVVWLHHLLNTNKRKQALNPAQRAITGITKPGYPGVLVYSGPEKDVYEHVTELKHLNWQAFQVRLETREAWTFNHGSGVIEVEAMKDVVADIDGGDRKEEFMEAMRMK